MLSVFQIKKYKDSAVFFGWIAGLLIIISLAWFLTQSVQSRNLLRTVNRMFVTTGQPHRLASHLTMNAKNSFLLGYWFTMHNSTDRMFVFAPVRDGILVPLGARVTANGEVEEIIPLSSHAMQTMENLPKSVLQMYIVRIESAAKNNAGSSKTGGNNK